MTTSYRPFSPIRFFRPFEAGATIRPRWPLFGVRRDASIFVTEQPLYLPCPAAQEENLDRVKQNQKIQPGRDVLYVVQVVAQFLQIVFMRRAVPASDLSPACNPRLDRRALTVERDFPGPSAFLGNEKGARTDEAHVSAKYVEKLRQFIKPVPAEPATHARGAVVVLLCRALGIRVKMHRDRK